MTFITTTTEVQKVKEDAQRYWGTNVAKVSVMNISSLEFVANNWLVQLNGMIPFIKLTINSFDSNPVFKWSLFNLNPYRFNPFSKPKEINQKNLNISVKDYLNLRINANTNLEALERNITDFDRIDGFCAIMCKEIIENNIDGRVIATEKKYVYFTYFKRKDNIADAPILNLSDIIITPNGGGGGDNNSAGVRIPS